jgi:hypothetical protein
MAHIRDPDVFAFAVDGARRMPILSAGGVPFLMESPEKGLATY